MLEESPQDQVETEMTLDQIEAERTKFEAWYRLPMDREGTGYRHDTAQDMWRGWLARAEEQYTERGHDATPKTP